MIRYRFLVFVAIVFSLIPSVTFALDGFPGSTWGELRWNLPTTGKQDLVLQGWVKQGVDLKRWSENTHLYTYVTLRYNWDSQENDWWNKLGPGAGIAVDTSLAKQFPVTCGVEYVSDWFYQSHQTVQTVVLYMNWYGWWDLKKK